MGDINTNTISIATCVCTAHTHIRQQMNNVRFASEQGGKMGIVKNDDAS